MFVLVVAVIVWLGCLGAISRADRLTELDLLTGQHWVLRVWSSLAALVGLVLIVLPSVLFVDFAVLNAIDGDIVGAVVTALAALAPVAISAMLLRRASRAGRSIADSLPKAVLGGAAVGLPLLAFALVAVAMTGM